MAKRFDPNTVVIGGRLTEKPQLRYTPAQKPVLSVTLANNQGEYNGQDNVSWLDVVIWGSQAENIARITDKGAYLVVEGQLATRTYEDNAGNRRKVTEVIARRVMIMDYGKRNDSGNNENATSITPNTDFPNPFATGAGGNTNFGANQEPFDSSVPNGGVVLDISDDDIPF